MEIPNLAQLELARDVDALVAALPHPEACVRAEAASALGRVGDARAVPALTACLVDAHSVDPADHYRGDRAWEEMGSEELIYPVREAARKALQAIESRPAGGTAEPAPASIQAGDLVEAWRHFDYGHFEDGGGTDYIGATLLVQEVGPDDVWLVVARGMVWAWDPAQHKKAYCKQGHRWHLKNSEAYAQAFPDALPYQEFLDTFKKVG